MDCVTVPQFGVAVPRMDPLVAVSMNVESPTDILRMSLSRVLTENEDRWLGLIKGNLA